MIPTYNCAHYLPETLASVLAQDPGSERMQIEVVDDALDEASNWSNIAPLEQRAAGVIPGWLEKIAVGQRLQTPCMVVRRQAYAQLGGFDRRLKRLGEDWEMWVRIAAHFPVAYEPTPLSLYRVHSTSLTGGVLRTGHNVRDLRRVIEINREHFAPAEADEITRRALRETATTCLRRARRLLGAGDAGAMWAQVREAVRSDASARILAEASALVAARFILPLVGWKRRAG